MRTVYFILIASAGIFMVFANAKYYKFFRSMNDYLDDMPRYFRPLTKILQALMIFFIIAFIGAGVSDVLFREKLSSAAVISFIGYILTFFIIYYLSLGVRAFADKNRQLKECCGQREKQKLQLKSEVASRVEDVMQQSQLLRAVNDMASILLASGVEDYNESVLKCMRMLAESVGVDRTYIWENYYENGLLYCTQVFEWSGGADPQQGNDLTVNVRFPEDWYEPLSNNRCINGIVENFQEYEREHLKAQGIISILVVPIFLQDKFWGFFGFDDCHNERIFSTAEEVILRSGSLLIATSMLRNEITQNLVHAREEALSSTKAKSNFLSNMSHEIRTPINAITGMTAIARKYTDLDKISDCLDKIDSASHQLLGIINDILDVSKIEAGKMELSMAPFDLPQMLQKVKSIIEIRANEKSQSFILNIGGEVPKIVVGDDVRLSQIFINLLSNAVKFTPEKGEISLNLRFVGKNEGRFILEAEVCDTGIGISPDEQQRLFRAFEQADRNTSRKYGGTGLGLVISKSIAKLMHGDITVKSRPGEGSCFIVRFQLKEGNPSMLAKTEENAQHEQADFSKFKALLVEDIEINREIVMELLEPTKLAIDCAENGKEAVKIFGANPDKYDIIFMDIQMPEMDGYQTTQSIRALNAGKSETIPIIAMTANAYKEDVEKALASGMNDHISKPIDINAVIQVITKYLR